MKTAQRASAGSPDADLVRRILRKENLPFRKIAPLTGWTGELALWG
ncbi:MAG: hypothetical protein QW057_03225 [Candidatus Bathyarchaeia archaeon]